MLIYQVILFVCILVRSDETHNCGVSIVVTNDVQLPVFSRLYLYDIIIVITKCNPYYPVTVVNSKIDTSMLSHKCIMIFKWISKHYATIN